MSLQFLRPGELQSEIERLIAYHERLIGQPQRLFSLDEARACVGDYRLAHCLLATLSHWYSWQQPDWLATLREREAVHLVSHFASPMHLRLALYSAVNEHHQGFLGVHEREQALQTFASQYHLSPADLEHFLALDSEAETLLVRTTERLPEALEVSALYNQWTFEAALLNASVVHIVLDCQAFVQTRAGSHEPGVGVGALIKRLCYLARKLGVYYDLAYEQTLFDGSAPTHLTLTLYGPQDVTGAPQQYGLRLARLCRLLLGYGRPKSASRPARKHATLSSSALVEATATVHFLQRTYRFVMDAELLHLLPSGEQATDEESNRSGTEASSIFDSSIEQNFSGTFVALANSQGVDGWQLEREPEPLLLENSIFIPDFALSRGQQRLYVEILGFWTPSYRERKIQKLQHLKDRNDLLLAIPLEAKEAFTAIQADFPIVYYQGQLAITDIVQTLRTHYDDFAARLALIDRAAIQALIRREGLFPEQRCYTLLHCYRRSELQTAAERITSADILFLPGVGLCHVPWLDHLKQEFVTWLHAVGTTSFPEVVREMRTRWPALATCEDTALEILLVGWPEVRIQRSSIFEATVEVVDEAGPVETTLETPEAQPTAPQPARKRQVRERRPSLKKHDSPVQEGLWN